MAEYGIPGMGGPEAGGGQMMKPAQNSGFSGILDGGPKMGFGGGPEDYSGGGGKFAVQPGLGGSLRDMWGGRNVPAGPTVGDGTRYKTPGFGGLMPGFGGQQPQPRKPRELQPGENRMIAYGGQQQTQMPQDQQGPGAQYQQSPPGDFTSPWIGGFPQMSNKKRYPWQQEYEQPQGGMGGQQSGPGYMQQGAPWLDGNHMQGIQRRGF